MKKMPPLISIIAAIGKNRELGKDNRLLWNIPEDMKRFKEITTGHPVIMGRATFESIGKALPNRINIVVTRNKEYKGEGCLICHSIEEAIQLAKSKDSKEIFIIGGGKIYEQGIKHADKLYLTLVDGEFIADTFFPDYQEFDKIILQKDNKSLNHSFTFLILSR